MAGLPDDARKVVLRPDVSDVKVGELKESERRVVRTLNAPVVGLWVLRPEKANTRQEARGEPDRPVSNQESGLSEQVLPHERQAGQKGEARPHECYSDQKPGDEVARGLDEGKTEDGQPSQQADEEIAPKRPGALDEGVVEPEEEAPHDDRNLSEYCDPKHEYTIRSAKQWGSVKSAETILNRGLPGDLDGALCTGDGMLVFGARRAPERKRRDRVASLGKLAVLPNDTEGHLQRLLVVESWIDV